MCDVSFAVAFGQRRKGSGEGGDDRCFFDFGRRARPPMAARVVDVDVDFEVDVAGPG